MTVMALPLSIGKAARAVLQAGEPSEKIRLSNAAAKAWEAGELSARCDAMPPARPARPVRPQLLPPRDMPRRRKGGERGRIALLHALAHIELNAIDLAWDIIARFGQGMPRGFIDDWIKVAVEEAKHHGLLAARLADMGACYGDLPAHDGLWEAAERTAHDLLARLAIVPLVLEARGLDVTPEMAGSLDRAGDPDSAAIVRLILADEIGHVATGHRWFEQICLRQDYDPANTWRALVAENFKGQIKPPFNRAARDAAGFSADYYEPMAAVTLHAL